MEGGRGHSARIRSTLRLKRAETGSTLSHLEGGLSGRRYEADALMGLDPIDQRPLLARYDLARARQTIGCEQMATRRSGRLWRWAELLPVRSQAFIIYLGEGETPLQPARHLGSWLGLTNMSVKRESLNPTGSFKARGMAVAVGRAVELGAKHLVAASAGNAGGALAAYSAAAGVRATVIMPADAPAQNQVEVLATGAGLLLLEGLISDSARLATARCDRVSHRRRHRHRRDVEGVRGAGGVGHDRHPPSAHVLGPGGGLCPHRAGLQRRRSLRETMG
ncbi:MAG: pyridoxal-phosphate dependent enzyme [Chloroflexi bacterium]|nr:MAG: pyridoxal-phosphate dependent enzyme [Chloroflexota bacterium]